MPLQPRVGKDGVKAPEVLGRRRDEGLLVLEGRHVAALGEGTA